MLWLLTAIFPCVSVALRGEKQCIMSNKDFSLKPLTTKCSISINKCFNKLLYKTR